MCTHLASSFAGLGTYFYAHDGCVTEGAGEIQDRTQEHLGQTDRAIVAQRLMLLKGIADMQAGKDPVGVVRAPPRRTTSTSWFAGKTSPRIGTGAPTGKTDSQAQRPPARGRCRKSVILRSLRRKISGYVSLRGTD